MIEPFRVNILGVGVSAINMTMALDFMEWSIAKKLRTYISVCPVSTVLACLDDPDVRRAVNRAGLSRPTECPLCGSSARPVTGTSAGSMALI